ncbi:MAG TPA: ethanolamine utilization protein EutN [Cyanobacteria bacterium UBA8530]|nr:ethanolamine utilization protein EutN [Cyanobacteria bacterium UBA8530]
MMLGKVIGTVNSTLKHEALKGSTLLLVQPLSEALAFKGVPFVAVDTVQAGVGATVLVGREGGSARMAMGNDQAPVHAAIFGIVDFVKDQKIK